MDRARKRDIVKLDNSGKKFEVLDYNQSKARITSEDSGTYQWVSFSRLTPFELYDPHFEVGQRIRCIDDSGCNTLVKGWVYTVESRSLQRSHCHRDQRIRLEEEDPTYLACRFESCGLDYVYDVEKIKDYIREEMLPNLLKLTSRPSGKGAQLEPGLRLYEWNDCYCNISFKVLDYWYTFSAPIDDFVEDPREAYKAVDPGYMSDGPISSASVTYGSKKLRIKFKDGSELGVSIEHLEVL